MLSTRRRPWYKFKLREGSLAALLAAAVHPSGSGRRTGGGAETGPGQRSIICNCTGTSASPPLPLTAITALLQVWRYLASVLAWQRSQSTIETKRIQETKVCLTTKHLPVVIIVLRQSSHQHNTSTPSSDHWHAMERKWVAAGTWCRWLEYNKSEKYGGCNFNLNIYNLSCFSWSRKQGQDAI